MPARSSTRRSTFRRWRGTTPTPRARCCRFPFNSSTTVFYYNMDAFEKAGLDPKRAPATWPEVMAAAAKIKAAGASHLQLHHRLAVVGAARKLLRLAQHGVRDQGERLRRQRPQAPVQRTAAGAPHRQHAGLGEEGLLHLRRPRQQARGEVLQRRMRDAHVVVGGLRHDQAERQVQVHGRRRCPITPTSRARRRTPSSAAPRCG